MKKLLRIAGVAFFLILFSMVTALVQYERMETTDLLPQQIAYFFNEDWTVARISRQKTAQIDLSNTNQLQTLIKDTLAENNGIHTNLPYKGDSEPGDIIVYKNILPKDYAGLTLNFSSKNALVHVFIDETLIYEHDFNEHDSHQKPSEPHEHFADIPKVLQNGELWITLTSPSPNMAASLVNVSAETRDTIIISVVEGSIADIGCCLLILLMTIIMFVLALIRRHTNQPARGEIFLGLAGLSAGIYCFIGTDTLNIFYNLQSAYALQEYLVLLIPLFLALYFERNLHTLYPLRFSVLVLYTSLNAIVQLLLQVLNIWRLKNMVYFSAAALCIVCVIAMISLIQYDYKTRGYQTVLSALSMLVLLLGEFANIIINKVFKSNHNNMAGQYSMALFGIMMAVMHILQLSKEYRMHAEENAKLLAEKVKITEQQNMQLAIAKKDADAARHEALAANDAKGRFLAHMSHEIRTPINAVLGMDEMILRESKEPNIKEYAMDIYTAGQTLLSLINDILDFSKIESGKMEIVPIEYDISSMIHDLSNMAMQRAKDKNIRLEVNADPSIPSRLYGDDVRIRQVLTNILTNAVKYTQEGTIWLRIQCQKINADGTAVLKFEVEDTGIGIKEEDLPKLCAEFERIEENRNRNIEGTGLGMSITLQLLSLLDSSLHAESTYGKGSKFSFELKQKIIDQAPIGDFKARAQQAAESYIHHTKFCAPDAKILIVDDNAVNRKVLQNLLKETQIQITDADGGAKCLELVQKNYYDLIFLDHMMPEMDGIETLHHIKELSDFPCKNSPIIVLTANAVSGAKEKYIEEGFDDYLSKPIVAEKLEKMIQKMLPEKLVQKVPDGQKSPASSSLQTEQTASPDDFIQSLPQIDGLDWHYAWLHLPDKDLLEYTVKEFYAQIDTAANHLEQAYEQITNPDQLNSYRIQVHAMKSLAATVGIAPLFGLAKVLESAAKDGKIDRIKAVTPVFLHEWRSYQEKLQGVFGIQAIHQKDVTEPSLIQALLEMLRLSMQMMDIDQADELSRQLQQYHYPDELNEPMQKLAEAVTNLDADEADRLAGQLIEAITVAGGRNEENLINRETE